MAFAESIQVTEKDLAMWVVSRAASVVVVAAVPSAVGENNAAAQGKDGQQGNQQCDSTEHFKILMVIAAMKPKGFIGCNMRPRLQRPIPGKR